MSFKLVAPLILIVWLVAGCTNTHKKSAPEHLTYYDNGQYLTRQLVSLKADEDRSTKEGHQPWRQNPLDVAMVMTDNLLPPKAVRETVKRVDSIKGNRPYLVLTTQSWVVKYVQQGEKQQHSLVDMLVNGKTTHHIALSAPFSLNWYVTGITPVKINTSQKEIRRGKQTNHTPAQTVRSQPAEPVRSFNCPGKVIAIRLLADRHTLVCSSEGWPAKVKYKNMPDWPSTISWWDIRTGRLLSRSLRRGYVRALCQSPDHKTLVSQEDGGMLCMWNVSNFRLVRKIRTRYIGDCGLAFSPGGRLLAVGDSDVVIYNTRTWRIRRILRGFKGGYTTEVAFSRDGSLIAGQTILQGCGSWSELALWNTHTGKLLRYFDSDSLDEAYPWLGGHLFFLGDDRHLVSGSGILDYKSHHAKIRRLTQDEEPSVGLYRTGTNLVVHVGKRYTDTLRLLDANTRKLKYVWTGFANLDDSVHFLSDRGIYIVGTEDGIVGVWRLKQTKSYPYKERIKISNNVSKPEKWQYVPPKLAWERLMN